MSGPPFARYHSWGDDVEVEVGITIAGDTPGQGEVTRGALPAGRVARVVHTGPYPSLGEAYQAVEAWMRANGHEGTAPPWEVYLTDPQTPDLKPDDYKTEILWPIG
jgi:effector-binding domain-containing protein